MEESSNVPSEPEDTPLISESVQPVDHEHYTPRPFKEIPLLWLKIFKMDVAFFENEIQHTSTINTLLGVLLYSCINSILVYYLSYLNSVFAPIAEHPFSLAIWDSNFSNYAIPFNVLIRTPLCFYFGEFLFFLIGRIFKGKGSFNEQIYLKIVYYPMIQFIYQIGRFFQYTFSSFYTIAIYLPLLGLSIYSTILCVRSFRIAHKFSAGKAFAIIFGSTFAYIFFYAVIMTFLQ